MLIMWLREESKSLRTYNYRYLQKIDAEMGQFFFAEHNVYNAYMIGVNNFVLLSHQDCTKAVNYHISRTLTDINISSVNNRATFHVCRGPFQKRLWDRISESTYSIISE